MRVLLVLASFLCTALAVVEQVRLALTGNMGEMQVSWISDTTGSVVKVGTTSGVYNVGNFLGPNGQPYKLWLYKSGNIHFVTLTGLKPSTKYYYVCSDGLGWSSEFSFSTPLFTPHPVSFGLIGDIGQTLNSQLTATSMMSDPVGIELILHVGDLSYADGWQPLWDTYGRMFQNMSAKIPWMVIPGNHENEFFLQGFTAYQARFSMPSASSNPASKNLFWSINYSWAHIVALSTESAYTVGSEQYNWFIKDMQSVNRAQTPWIIVMFHRPYYNSNTAHQGEVLDFKPIYEPLLGKYCVDIALVGHVHSYERTLPVYNGTVGTDYPQYFNIGDGGNREGLAKNWYAQPAWSAFRKAAYGYSRMDMFNQTHMQHSWFANDHEFAMLHRDQGIQSPMEAHVASDAVLIVKNFPRTCSLGKPN